MDLYHVSVHTVVDMLCGEDDSVRSKISLNLLKRIAHAGRSINFDLHDSPRAMGSKVTRRGVLYQVSYQKRVSWHIGTFKGARCSH